MDATHSYKNLVRMFVFIVGFLMHTEPVIRTYIMSYSKLIVGVVSLLFQNKF